MMNQIKWFPYYQFEFRPQMVTISQQRQAKYVEVVEQPCLYFERRVKLML
jgi:hypothetical protein